MKEGKILDVKAAGEPRFPVHICSVQKSADHLIGAVDSKDRLTQPLKRAGERGEGKWVGISWDEALDTIAQKLMQVRDDCGPEDPVMRY